MSHTATPWFRNIPPASKYPVIFAGRNTHVCVVATHGLPEPEIEANADFILRAVNSHDDLVNALERVRFALNGTVGQDFALLIPDTVKAIDEALAKARA